MRTKLIGLALALAITSTPVMAINPWKALVVALAGFSAAQGFDPQGQCEEEAAPCQYFEDYQAFGNYLEGLTNCEKEKLFPAMEMRYKYIDRTAKALKKAAIVDGISRDEVIQRMHDISEAYTIELKVLNNELLKTQEILFDDCTSKESQAILGEHASVLIDSISLHHENLEALKKYLAKRNSQ